MAAIVRKLASIFGSALTPSGNLARWASLATGSVAYSADPEAIQTPAWAQGLNAALIGNRSPAQEDLNALFYVLSYQIAYLLERGLPEWHSGTTYFKNDIVRIPGTQFVASSLTDNNTGNDPATDSNNWDLTAISCAVGALTSGSPQVIPIDNAPHLINFNATTWNPRGYWDTGAYKFTAPVAGLYEVTVNLQIDNQSPPLTGIDGFLRVVNFGGGGYHIAQGWGQNNPPGQRWYPLLSGPVKLTAGQQIAIYAGGNGPSGNVSVSNSFLMIRRVV